MVKYRPPSSGPVAKIRAAFRRGASHLSPQVWLTVMVPAALMLFGCLPDPWMILQQLGTPAALVEVALRAPAVGLVPADRTRPVTLIGIDERTDSAWGHPDRTPRAALTVLIDRATLAGAASVLVDIDLGFTADEPPQGPAGDPLLAFLQQYRGDAVVVFPRPFRQLAEGIVEPIATPFDEVFRSSDRLRWGHAVFEPGSNGIVTHWRQVLPQCATAASEEWTSVVFHLVRNAGNAQQNGALEGCAGEEAMEESWLPIAPSLAHPTQHVYQAGLLEVSALDLLTDGAAVDDASLLTGRIVGIGSVHARSGDLWTTVAGPRYGVELLLGLAHLEPALPKAGGLSSLMRRLLAIFTFLAVVVLLGRANTASGMGAVVVAFAIYLGAILAVIVTGSLGAVEVFVLALSLSVWYAGLLTIYTWVEQVLRYEAASRRTGFSRLAYAMFKATFGSKLEGEAHAAK